MSVLIGRMLGPYQIVSFLGAGGMGEVYVARDTRLNRSVAIKILPSGFLHDETARARFDREARAISSLAHPNICAVHDVGYDDGDAFMVMEMLEGESLADRLARGALPVSQIARYGAQIADALQHAHRAGITHRDLKPGNIMITGSGAKLLDFGLAKFMEPAETNGSEQAALKTEVQPLTAEGMVIGTFQYLSPEQLEGKTVDHRTDIFALGVVLYEMAVGRRPFLGDTRTALATAILTSDPVPIRSLQPAIPAALERIIITALEKRAEDRWQTAHDVGRQLQWLTEFSNTTEAAAAPRHRRPLPTLVAIGTAIAASLITWLAVRQMPREPESSPHLRLQIGLPPDRTPVHGRDLNAFALSPDGKTLCFLTGRPRALYLRRLDSLDIRKIEGSEGSIGPFWSADGKFIAFSAQGKLWKTSIAPGAVPDAICNVGVSGATGSWVGDTILFGEAAEGGDGIYRVLASGGTPVRAVPRTAEHWRHSWPAFLPDGEKFLYLAQAANSLERQVILASLNSPERSILLRNVSKVRIVGTDRLVYVRDGKLMWQRFNANEGVIVGDPVPIADRVAYFYATASADFDVSSNGVVVYLTDTSGARLSLATRQGVETRLLDDDEGLVHLSLSRDGTRAAAAIMSRGTRMGDIWIYDLARGIRDRFTSEPGMEVYPVWSPDGRTIAYSHTQGGSVPYVVQRPFSSTVSEVLTPPGPFLMPRSFSPDGNTLFIHSRNPVTRGDIFRLSMKTKKLEPFVSTTFVEQEPEVSPDGRWLAFSSDATGVAEVYLQDLENAGASRLRISSKGGRVARWRGDSGELFYLTNDGRMDSAVPGVSGQWGDARLTELFTRPSISTFEVLPDGQSLLLLEENNPPEDSLFQVVVGLP